MKGSLGVSAQNSDLGTATGVTLPGPSHSSRMQPKAMGWGHSGTPSPGTSSPCSSSAPCRGRPPAARNSRAAFVRGEHPELRAWPPSMLQLRDAELFLGPLRSAQLSLRPGPFSGGLTGASAEKAGRHCSPLHASPWLIISQSGKNPLLCSQGH